MNINKDLNRDSSTKDLLKFATEHGYHDNEGMDNSPSWMSQELDERVFAESKSCHPVLVKGEIPMTYTEKIDEMVRDFCSVAPKSKSEVRQRISESIHQAKAEERERVHRLVKLYGTPNCDYLHHNKKQQHESGEICPVVTEITDLLSKQ